MAESRPPRRRTAARVLRYAALGIGLTALLLAAEVAVVLSGDYLGADDARSSTATLGGASDDSREPLRLVLLGDSTTAGVGATGTATTLGVQLAERVAAATGRTVTVTSVGVSGARAEDLGAQVPDALATRPDLAVVVVGANDATHVTPLGAVRREVAATLRALQEAGVAVVLGSCPDMGSATAFPQPLRTIAAWRGRAVGTVSRQAAAALRVPTVDIGAETGPTFRAEPERMLSEDRFHPSDEGYGVWADALAVGALAALP